jgi:hypothetical protein
MSARRQTRPIRSRHQHLAGPATVVGLPPSRTRRYSPPHTCTANAPLSHPNGVAGWDVTLDQASQVWTDCRFLRFGYRSPVGSGRPHRTDLEPFSGEINTTNLAPCVNAYARSFFHEIRIIALDRDYNVREHADRYAIPDDFAPHTDLSRAWAIVAGPPLKVRLYFHHDVDNRPRAHLGTKYQQNPATSSTSAGSASRINSSCDNTSISFNALAWSSLFESQRVVTLLVSRSWVTVHRLLVYRDHHHGRHRGAAVEPADWGDGSGVWEG